jgi:hypothetical protein
VEDVDELPQLEMEPETVELVTAADEDWQDDTLVWAESDADGEWEAAAGELLLEDEVQVQQAKPDTSMDPVATGNNETRHQREAAVMFDSTQSQGAVATMAAGKCDFCEGSLPGGRVVKFCPHCGSDQTLQPCGSCREPLEPGWKFCIGCGHQQS